MNDVKKLLIKNRASLETGLYFIVRGVDGVLDSSLSEQDPTNQPRSHGFSRRSPGHEVAEVEWSMS